MKPHEHARPLRIKVDKSPAGEASKGVFRLLVTVALLASTSSIASAGVVLKLGDILVAEPGTSSISVVDPSTGIKTLVSEGGLLAPANKTVGAALSRDGDIVVVNRLRGLIRINPFTGAQTVLSHGGHFRDPWAIAVNRTTGDIYVADSGYDNDRPEINEAGRIIRVDPTSGAQELIASGAPCTVFPAGAACQNTTTAGSYLAHPYGIAIDYAISPGTLIVADMSAFNGQGAIIRIQPVPFGSQTLLWGPAAALPPPQVVQAAPLGCPMGVTVEPNGNLLTTVFSFPVPPAPTVPPPAGTFYGCAPPGIFRLDLASNAQRVFNSNAPPWQPSRAYSLGEVVRDATSETVHRVVTAGVSSGSVPIWSTTLGVSTTDGSVLWENLGSGANWLIPFGIGIEPAPTPTAPARYRVIVGDEGYSMLFRLDEAGAFVSPVPLVSNTSNVTSLDVISFTPPGGFKTEPIRSNGLPSGSLAAGTTQTTLQLTTDVNATCRYSHVAGVAYGSMPNTFSTTGSTTHATLVSGLTDGVLYRFYVRCLGTVGQANSEDFIIAFSVGPVTSATSTFAGVESQLSEGGAWDSPGAWADLQKNNGAFAVGLNASARLVTPSVTPNQYSEITYSEDPGAASWVGVTTRVQGPDNGSGYLAIAYAGEVRLYRTDDSGALSFSLLASASVDLNAAPRRLRLESTGDTHRVYFNGALSISHSATGTIYATGQPGIAASVFGGPQVKILSFEGGSLSDVTQPTLSVNSVTVNEGDVGSVVATFTVTLSATSAQTVTVNYATSNGTATATQDYTGASGTLTFVPGATTQTVAVPVLGDLLDESDETLFLTLSAATNATIAVGVGIGTITDNDTFPSLAINSVTVTEADPGIAFRSASQGGSTTTTLTIAKPAGTIQNDVLIASIGFRANSPGQFSTDIGITPPTSWVLVRRIDNPGPSGSGLSIYRLVAGATEPASYTWTFSCAATCSALGFNAATGGIATFSGVDTTAPIVVENAAATATTRNLLTPSVTTTVANTMLVTTHTLPNGDTWQNPPPSGMNQAFQVTTGAEAIQVSWALQADAGPTGQRLATDLGPDAVDTGIGAILALRPAPAVSTAVFTVGLSAASSQTVTVSYATTDGTATTADYDSTAGLLTFAPGATAQPLSVVVRGDFVDEADETFVVNLSGAVNATIGNGVGIGTIVDNDTAPSLSINDVSLPEGNAGTSSLTLTVALSAPSLNVVTVNYATTNGTAVAGTTGGADYVATSGTLSFSPGVTTQTISVPVRGDATFEPNETFVVGLSGATNATIADTQGVGTIVNDDVPSLTINNVTVTESNTGTTTAQFTVTLGAASTQTVTVGYTTANGTATAGSDYTSTTGTLSFTPGATARTISVTVSGDLLDEANETFFVNLAGPTNATIGDGQGTGTITDNDPTPSLAINNVSLTEGNSGTKAFTFTVTLSAASGRTVTVNHATANGSAIAGTTGSADYVAMSGTLTFNAGTTTQNITVFVRGDTTNEGNQTFFVNLTAASNATIADTQGQGTILNDD